MAPLKFCANISWLFAELPELTQRMRDAARAGFRAVEAAWIYSSDLKELKTVKDETGLEFALINTPPVSRIHLMAGRVPAGADRCAVAMEMEDTFVQNLKHAAGVLSKEGILGLIEPINTRITDPRYFLDSPHQAAVILQRVAHPSIRMQMDIYHWQIMDGNLTQNIRKYLPMTGHIQIAQVPDRHEPDSDGELSYTYLFKLLEELDYQDYIGCEYKPQRSTEAGLDWLRRYWSSHN
ncbi:putative hydroxypyruvate isomerase [Sinocyclocheilus grahami]|uniref:putative hydroxypyruvate isomerase n=1 Tax=Sinocyclocheilus grahami TaxID=75366 RepID=UPI0007AD2A85|nr:PREDICTED: putative hydroxypyruvate isomerase [Sinocyclocheilus grahami]